LEIKTKHTPVKIPLTPTHGPKLIIDSTNSTWKHTEQNKSDPNIIQQDLENKDYYNLLTQIDEETT